MEKNKDITKTKYIVNLVTGIISVIITILIFTRVIPVEETLSYVIGTLLGVLGIYYIYSGIRGLVLMNDDGE